MFILSFFLSYFLKINKENCKTLLERSYKTPVFLLIFSPHCPHCTKIHPTWEELMKKYEKDEKVIISECNAIENRNECRSICSYQGFPSFFTIFKGHAKNIRPQRTMESFINETELLKKIDLTIPCSTYQSEFDYKYPAFVLTNNESPDKKCQKLQEITEAYPQAKTHLYVNESNSEKESFVAHLSSSQKVEYKGEMEPHSLVGFIKDSMMTPFGEWNYSEAVSSKRRIGLLIHNSQSEYLSFNRMVEPYFANFSLCKIYLSKFESIFPQYKIERSEVPAFAISNKEKTKFVVMFNVLRNKRFDEFVKKATDGELDSEANFSLSALFPLEDKKREKIVDLNQTNKNSTKRNSSVRNQIRKVRNAAFDDDIKSKRHLKDKIKRKDDLKENEREKLDGFPRKNIKRGKNLTAANRRDFLEKRIGQRKNLTRNYLNSSHVIKDKIEKIKGDYKKNALNRTSIKRTKQGDNHTVIPFRKYKRDKSNENLKSDDNNKLNAHDKLNKGKDLKENQQNEKVDKNENQQNKKVDKNENQQDEKVEKNEKKFMVVFKPTRTSIPSKLATTNFKIFVGLTVFLCIAFVVGFMIFINNADRKIE